METEEKKPEPKPTTLLDLKKDGYAYFGSLPEPEKIDQMRTIRYVEILASQSGISAFSWDALGVFGNDEKKLLVTDRSEINRRFFEAAANRPSPTASLPPEMEAKIKEISGIYLSQRLERIKGEASGYEEDAASYLQNFEKHMKLAAKAHRDHDAVLLASNAPEAEFKKIAAGGFWIPKKAYGDKIDFETASDISLNYKNPAAGLDLHVNLGRFIARIMMSSNVVLLYPHLRNKNWNGRNHPHQLDEKHVCWGSAQEEVVSLMARGEYAKVLEILANVLVNYNASDAAVDLGHFVELEAKDAMKFEDHMFFEPNDLVEVVSTSCPQIRRQKWGVGKRTMVLGLHSLNQDDGAESYMVAVDGNGSLTLKRMQEQGTAPWNVDARCLRLVKRLTKRPVKKIAEISEDELNYFRANGNGAWLAPFFAEGEEYMDFQPARKPKFGLSSASSIRFDVPPGQLGAVQFTNVLDPTRPPPADTFFDDASGDEER